MKKKKTAWRLLAKALGEKSGKNDNEADRIALIRLVMFLSIFITNCFIVANAVRHWNDETKIYVIIDGSNVSGDLFQTEKEGLRLSTGNVFEN